MRPPATLPGVAATIAASLALLATQCLLAQRLLAQSGEAAGADTASAKGSASPERIAVQPYTGSSLRDPYRVEASLSSGPALTFFRMPRAPQSDAKHDYGGGAMLRVMWHPGRLLAFGLATGYVLLSDEQLELDDAPVASARAVLTAIQLQVCASMQKGGFEIGAGVGPYIMRTSITDEDHSSASRMELALTGFASYDIHIDERLRTGPALRCIYWSYRGVLTFIPEWRLRYDLVLY